MSAYDEGWWSEVYLLARREERMDKVQYERIERLKLAALEAIDALEDEGALDALAEVNLHIATILPEAVRGVKR